MCQCRNGKAETFMSWYILTKQNFFEEKSKEKNENIHQFYRTKTQSTRSESGLRKVFCYRKPPKNKNGKNPRKFFSKFFNEASISRIVSKKSNVALCSPKTFVPAEN